MDRPAHAQGKAALNESIESPPPTRALNAALHRLAPPTTECGAPSMNQLTKLPERAMDLAGHVGSGLRGVVPAKAVQWVETGAALAALKTGGRVATRVVKRNPAIAVAAVAGAGLLWLAARRRAKRREEDSGNGGRATKRVEARRAPRTTSRTNTRRRSASSAG